MSNKLYNHGRCIEKNDIISIQINLLNKCTSHCKSCRKYTWPDNVLDFDVLSRTIRELRIFYGLETIVFSGGDPVLYPRFSEVIDLCNDLGIKFSLITTLITDDVVLLHRIALYAERIHVSVDAVDNDSYKYIRGVDAFSIANANIEFIQNIRLGIRKIPIRISTTVSKMNCNLVRDIYAYALKNQCDLNYYLIHTWDDLKMTDEDINRFYKDLIEIKESEPVINVNAEALLCDRFKTDLQVSTCGIHKIHCLIDSDGSIYPCCKLLNDNGEYKDQIQYAYGNINEWDLPDQFENRFNSKYPLNCSLCSECSDRYKSVNEYLEGMKNKKPLFL